ncbi:hypothetical protein [Halococcus salifodinae]|nr:hypothetical protein [Halococcus salifodinae]
MTQIHNRRVNPPAWTESGTDVDMDEIDAREIPIPAHSWSPAKRVIRLC